MRNFEVETATTTAKKSRNPRNFNLNNRVKKCLTPQHWEELPQITQKHPALQACGTDEEKASKVYIGSQMASYRRHNCLHSHQPLRRFTPLHALIMLTANKKKSPLRGVDSKKQPQRHNSAEATHYSTTIFRAPDAVTTTYTPFESSGIESFLPP